MPRTVAHSTLSGLIDDTDSDDAQYPTPVSANENMVALKKGQGRASKVGPTKVVKAKAPTTRRTSAGKAAPRKKGRPALADKSNDQDAGDETEEVDEFDQPDNSVVTVMTDGDELDASIVVEQPKKSGRPAKKTVPTAAATKSKNTKDASRLKKTVAAEAPEAPRISKTTKASKKPSQIKPSDGAGTKEESPERVIQETQESMMDVDDYEEEEVTEEPIVKPVKSVQRASSKTRHPSVQPLRKRAGSGSDTERNDPALRRKLGDITRENEKLKLKYDNLREIGVVQAEEKFERLRKQQEQSAKTANALIASLKAQLAAQETQLKEARLTKKQLTQSTAENSKLQSEISKLTDSLSETNIENKNLKATLAAKRVAASTVESASARAPGSAVKAGGIRLMGTQEAAEAAEKASLKEDLYSDLTGLLIRDVKRETEEDVYDCIQTGRNGTLHFKLAVTNDKAAATYDEAQCSYLPLLEDSRDRELMELLGTEAEYLVEEITFPRPHAAKFYAKVVKALTEKKA